jgi:splicing factor U2AF subunit
MGRGDDDRYDDRGGYDDRAPRDDGAVVERKPKKKKRARSSESASRSREREMMRRKKQQQYVAKQGTGQGTPGLADAGGQRMFWDGFQWVPRTEGVSTNNPNDPNVNRKMRRLYLGNLPYHLGITEDSFSKQLYDTMKDRGMCNDPNQNPVLHVWFSRDKGANYGFCEISSIEECDRALQLDGMIVNGVPVSIKRPTDSGPGPGAVAGVPGGAGGAGGSVGMLALPAMQVQATSSLIRIDELLKVHDGTTKDEYEDVVLDMKEGCGEHGRIRDACVVKKDMADPAKTLKAGDVFILCYSMEDATKIMRAMGHRKYDGRPITMKSWEDDKWKNVIKPMLG